MGRMADDTCIVDCVDMSEMFFLIYFVKLSCPKIHAIFSRSVKKLSALFKKGLYNDEFHLLTMSRDVIFITHDFFCYCTT